MAATDLSGFNGGVTFPSGVAGPAAGFTVRRQMRTKDVGRYGGGIFERSRGGSIRISGDITFFFQAHAATTSPGWVTPVADGGALTLTLDTGCTLTGTAIFADLSANHSFTDPAIEGTQSYIFTGTVVEAWAVS